MRPGFWEMMFDSEYRQRTDINEALAMEQHMSNDISVLHAQVRALQDHVRDLSVTVAAMLEILVEQNRLDPGQVRQRAEAMLAELQKPPPAPPPPPAIAHPRPPPLNTAPMTCTKCGRTVPAHRTLMTETGPICDPACP